MPATDCVVSLPRLPIENLSELRHLCFERISHAKEIESEGSRKVAAQTCVQRKNAPISSDKTRQWRNLVTTKARRAIQACGSGWITRSWAALGVLIPRGVCRPAREALRDAQYWKDVLAAGPGMGMTFMVAAGRDIPVPEAAQ